MTLFDDTNNNYSDSTTTTLTEQQSATEVHSHSQSEDARSEQSAQAGRVAEQPQHVSGPAGQALDARPPPRQIAN